MNRTPRVGSKREATQGSTEEIVERIWRRGSLHERELDAGYILAVDAHTLACGVALVTTVLLGDQIIIAVADAVEDERLIITASGDEALTDDVDAMSREE